MKIRIMVALLVIMLGCEGKNNNVEVLETYEFNYYTEKEVDTPIKINDDEDNKKLNSSFLDISNEIKKNYSEFPDKLDFHFRLFINENGKIDYIKNLKRPNPEYKLLVNSFITQIGNVFSKIEMSPAIKNGVNVKYRTDLKIGLENYSDSLKLFLPNFLENISKFNFKTQNKEQYFVSVEEMPTPIGGMNAIQSKIKYPEIAKRAGIQGRVYVKAFIDENGSVAQAEVIKGLDGGCSEAALRAVKVTKFTPGRKRGKAVKVQVSIPILFKLN